MKQDRFLLAILGGIGLLVVLALALFFIRQGKQAYQPDDSPMNVIQNYILALQKGDYQRAFRYLAEQEGKPTYIMFRDAFVNREIELAGTAVQFGSIDLNGDEASINLTMLHMGSSPFNEPYRDVQPANLIRHQGAWKILFAPYPFWGGWSSPAPKSVIPAPGD